MEPTPDDQKDIDEHFSVKPIDQKEQTKEDEIDLNVTKVEEYFPVIVDTREKLNPFSNQQKDAVTIIVK